MNRPSSTSSPRRSATAGFVARVLRLGAVVAAVVMATAVQGGTPLTAFALSDLNVNSSRLGRTLSPRDYGQWISAYYFGNEG
jgi:hypothetical protein